MSIDIDYEYVRATVTDGSLRIEYKIPGLVAGRQSHDEDVSEWTDDEIRDLVGRLLDVRKGLADTIDVIWN